MKSNVYKIEKGTLALDTILKESEKVAVYNELNSKQTLQLRLLCEELDGLLPNVVNDFEGEFWIDFENDECKINLSIKFKEFTANKKKELIAIAKNKKNAAVKGMLGKIRSALEDFFLDNEGYSTYGMSWIYNCPNENSIGVDYSYMWTLRQYKQEIKAEEQEWDELEKSIITSIADDVIVGVKGRTANIIIVKKFS